MRLLLPIFCACAFAQDHGKAFAELNETRLRADLTFLTSEPLKGRLSLERGSDVAIHWLVSEFTKAGLKPAAKAALLGLGLDGTDGHTRITTGKNFHLVGGSKETHEVMQETAIKLKAELQSPNTAAASSASTIATSKDTKSDDNAAPILAGTSWMTADRLYKVTFFDKAEVEVVWSTGPSRYQYTITKTKARGEWLITIPTTAGYHFRYEKAGKTLIGDDKNIYTKES